MQRVTITLDDDLLETLDGLSQRRGYNNRSEAIRDILRGALAQETTLNTALRASRCSRMFMSMRSVIWPAVLFLPNTTTTIYRSPRCTCINHDDCTEIAVLKATWAMYSILPMT